MNWSDEARNRLRKRFMARIYICFLSLLLISITAYIANCNQLWSNILMGVSCSALVWSIVELYDFFIDTYYKYIEEKFKFSDELNQEILPLRAIFRKNKTAEEIPWYLVKESVEKIRTSICIFSRKSDVFILTEEWENISNYITRLYWKTTSYITGSELAEEEELYSVFVDTRVISDYEWVMAMGKDSNDSATKWSALKNIEINITPVDQFLLSTNKLLENDIGEGKSLRLYQTFLKEVANINRTSIVALVFKLLFRKSCFVKFIDKCFIALKSFLLPRI